MRLRTKAAIFLHRNLFAISIALFSILFPIVGANADPILVGSYNTSGNAYGVFVSGEGSGESEGFPAGSRYDVSGTMELITLGDGGRASVWLKVLDAGTIKVNVKVPLTSKSSAKFLPAVPPDPDNFVIELSASP